MWLFQTQSYPWPLQGSLVSLERFIHSFSSSKRAGRLRESWKQGKDLLCSCNHPCQQSIRVCGRTLPQIPREICTCASRVPAKENLSFPPGFLPGRLPCVVLPVGFVCCGDSHSYQAVWNSYKRKNDEAPLHWSQEWGNMGEASHACEHSQPPSS